MLIKLMSFKIILALSCALLITSLLIPNHHMPWLSSTHELISFLSAILFFNLIIIQKKQTHFPKELLITLTTSLVPIIQHLSSAILLFGDTFISFIYIFMFSCMILSGYNLKKKSLTYWIAVALTTAATISALIGLTQWLIHPSSNWIKHLPVNSRPFANLGQPNLLSSLLSLGIASILFLYEKKILNRISSSLITSILILSIALTQSRTAWLMVIFLLLIWLWKYDSKLRRLNRTTAIAWACIFFSLTLTLPSIAEYLYLGGTTSVVERSKSLERWDLYTQFYHAIANGPLWGYGWLQAGKAQVAIAPFYQDIIYTQYTHNILLDLLIWNGPILGLIIIIFSAMWLFRLAIAASSTESMFALIAVGFFLIHSQLEFPHAYAFFLLPIGLLLGILQSETPSATWCIHKFLLWIISVASIILFIIIWRDYSVLEEDYQLMRFEHRRIGTLKAENPAPDVLILTQLQALIKHSRTQATPNMTHEQLNKLSHVAQRFTDPASIFKYVQALAINGDFDKAYEQLVIIRSLHGEKTLQQAISELDTMAQEHTKMMHFIQRLRANYPISSQ